MSLVSALAISVGVLGGVATWLFLGPLAGGLQIWVAFIAWACFFHCGGKESGLKATILANIAGAVMAWLTLLAVSRGGLGEALGLPVWAGICVGVGVLVMILLGHLPAFAAIPAMVYGFAAMAGYSLLVTDGLANLTVPSPANPLVTVVLSLIVGAALGYVSEKVAGMLVGSGQTRRA
ncbi:DUF1097 domain-containing protein [Ancylobacter dichloromethanicus]|uniref:DUF1097 domain-containing protein n=1 Tax=Ancylobacter dichloromethanicus TaxID=518825 RepID=A0A9W6N1N6_9HYPH|nr:DUF1097 domain-containing protein [Ancylobacter dichloromethanicus]MBS7553444.1 DUF1097 domain-containing protein [Ancylobacter dichloromethanicus]GLK74365.1 hypothetical protein GCM10017643_44830 [Ancylobacter dichloromethanicus]